MAESETEILEPGSKGREARLIDSSLRKCFCGLHQDLTLFRVSLSLKGQYAWLYHRGLALSYCILEHGSEFGFSAWCQAIDAKGSRVSIRHSRGRKFESLVKPQSRKLQLSSTRPRNQSCSGPDRLRAKPNPTLHHQS